MFLQLCHDFSFGTSGYELLDFFAVLEDKQSGDGHDLEHGPQVAFIINVDFRDHDLPVEFLRHLVNDRRQLLARSAPFRPKSTSTGLSDSTTTERNVVSVTSIGFMLSPYFLLVDAHRFYSAAR